MTRTLLNVFHCRYDDGVQGFIGHNTVGGGLARRSEGDSKSLGLNTDGFRNLGFGIGGFRLSRHQKDDFKSIEFDALTCSQKLHIINE